MPYKHKRPLSENRKSLLLLMAKMHTLVSTMRTTAWSICTMRTIRTVRTVRNLLLKVVLCAEVEG
jgi:hypothetical protein